MTCVSESRVDSRLSLEAGSKVRRPPSSDVEKLIHTSERGPDGYCNALCTGAKAGGNEE